MLETYKAKVRGNHISWNGDTPDVAKHDGEVEVVVTFLDKNTHNEAPRPSGLASGDFVVPENFDAPLADDILDGFEN